MKKVLILEEKNIPELRFPEFKGEWKKNTLSDISLQITKGTTPPKSEFRKEGVNFIKIENIRNNNCLDLNNLQKISNKCHKNKLARSILMKNDILFSIAGALGRTMIINQDILPANTNQALSIIRLHEKMNVKFVNYLLNLEKIKKYIHQNVTVGAQPNLSLEQVGNIKLSFPSYSEQEKLVSFMENIDKKIEFMEKKYTNLQNYRKSLIQQMYPNYARFSPNLNFEDEHWEEISLKDILVEVNLKTKINNEYPLLSSTVNGIYLQEEYFDRSVGSKSNIGYKILSKNEIVLSPQNLWMGNINVNDKYDKGIVSPSYKIFKVNKNVDINFLKYFLKTKRMVYEYKISSEQGASIVRRNLNMNLFLNIKIRIPSLKEQSKIAKMISTVSTNMEFLERKISLTKEFKRSLLSKMFC